MRKTNLFDKIKQRWIRFRFKPIPIFVFHSVSEGYNPLFWWECDWTQSDLFKQNILKLKRLYKFISLPEAHRHLKEDNIRFEKFAVLTADDGYRSLLGILPWLEEKKIPISLFINSCYLDKESWSEINEEQAKRTNPGVDMQHDVCPYLYMSKEELFDITSEYVTIGLHGHKHTDAIKLSTEDFIHNVKECKEILSQHPRYIPYYAYTWGHHNDNTDAILKDLELIPVLTSGSKNYKNTLDRICIDGISL